jgi:hypothetical protein
VTLSQALHILAETHTRDDDEIGFTVQAYVGNDFLTYRYSREEYIEAWKVVREHAHMQTEPAK